MDKRVAISQSNYIPWIGYFDLIASVDEFILYDDMQYTRRDWRNRNKIKTPHGVHWLTVPVQVKGKYHQLIKETLLDGDEWKATHLQTIAQNYRRSPFFSEIFDLVSPVYEKESFNTISEVNRRLIKLICRYLSIDTKISTSMDYHLTEGKTERLVSLCKQSCANKYYSGPAAQCYLDTELFSQSCVTVTWFKYGPYPQYKQLWGDFEPHVSVLDVLFNCGKETKKMLKNHKDFCQSTYR
ncbi:WbqC family protein [Alteromonas pelagimontana]|uniref:WbqC family protein n=1 Tax=Alteromonas pelagimontana TaxID=1858656 RepID=A0A6M4MG50_9ALTE|nr:WbqC family protein [Alteromonas pelagimontana]QJR81848.1 WbqC family protein [Alteromonas pelagimontana]